MCAVLGYTRDTLRMFDDCRELMCQTKLRRIFHSLWHDLLWNTPGGNVTTRREWSPLEIIRMIWASGKEKKKKNCGSYKYGQRRNTGQALQVLCSCLLHVYLARLFSPMDSYQLARIHTFFKIRYECCPRKLQKRGNHEKENRISMWRSGRNWAVYCASFATQSWP